MSERYKKLYSISDNLYVEGSPVIILAGNLLKDSYNDRIIVQVKYKNIQEKIIKALKVRVSPFSVTGHPLEANVDFQYLDLSAGRDGEFGSKTAIVLPNTTTRQFQICITEVVFLDNSIWTANESVPWVSQRTPLPLSSYLNEFEILKQYRISFPNANYIPTDTQGLWYCCCGAINESGERHCHSCHANKTELFEKLNIEYLVAEKESRLAAESAVASALALKKKQNTKKATRLIAGIAVILIFIVSVYFAFTMLLQPYLKYTKGLQLLEAGEYTAAIEVFTQLKDYKDSEMQLDLCIQMASEKKYNEALLLYEQGCYAEAIKIFAQLKGYKDSEKQIDLCNQMIVEEKYNKALLLYEEGKYVDAMGIFISLSGYKQSLHYLQKWNANTISAGGDHTLAVSTDGTVLATINTSKICITPFYNIEALSNIVSVSEGYYHANALKSDGTVVYMGNNADKYYNDISNWNSVVAIASGKDYTIGLKSDGTVLAVGVSAQKAIQVSDWSEIIAISVGATFEAQTTVGLKSNGTVVAVGDNTYGQCNVSAWSDIIAISAGPFHTVGLKKDGSVIATTPLGAYAQKGQCDVADWRNIVSISAGHNHTVGLKTDGTIVARGDNYWGQCDVEDWTDIVAISAGTFYTVGLKNDGTLVVAGRLKNGQCNVSGWQNIMLPSKAND